MGSVVCARCRREGVDRRDADEIVAALHKEQGDDSVEIKDKPLSVRRLEWEHLQKILFFKFFGEKCSEIGVEMEFLCSLHPG